MNKSYRQGQILKLIRAKRISTQEELAHELKAHGHRRHAGDALARHSRTGAGEDAEGYREMERRRERAAIRDAGRRSSCRTCAARRTWWCCRTAPGHANSVAVALDNEEWPEVVGTIAGDDTILVIAPDTDTANAVGEKLLGILRAG